MRCCWNLMLIPFKTAPKNPQIHGDMFHGLLGFFFPADLLLSRAWKWRNGGRERGRAMPGTSQTFSMPCPTSESSKFGRHRPLPAAPVVTASAAPSQGTLLNFLPAGILSPPRPSFGFTFKGALLHFSNLGRGFGHRFFRVWSEIRPCFCREKRK